jgi:hypothetical protein
MQCMEYLNEDNDNLHLDKSRRTVMVVVELSKVDLSQCSLEMGRNVVRLQGKILA